MVLAIGRADADVNHVARMIRGEIEEIEERVRVDRAVVERLDRHASTPE